MIPLLATLICLILYTDWQKHCDNVALQIVRIHFLTSGSVLYQQGVFVAYVNPVMDMSSKVTALTRDETCLRGFPKTGPQDRPSGPAHKTYSDCRNQNHRDEDRVLLIVSIDLTKSVSTRHSEILSLYSRVEPVTDASL